MFTTFTHMLNLVAFAAHAVLGCCGHHIHAGSAACAVSISQDHLECHASHDDHQPCDSHEKSRDQRIAIEIVDGLDVSHSDPLVPGDHSHGCGEPRCTYIASTLSSVDCCTHSASSVGIAFDSAPLSDSACKMGQFRYLSSLSRPLDDCSPTAQCALMQSWQI